MTSVLKYFDSSLFSERLSQVMKAKSLTQGQLAIASGLTQSAISKYLNRQRKPDIDALICLSTALDCEVCWLLGLECRLDAEEKALLPVGSDYVRLPPKSKEPLREEERNTLEKVLTVLRSRVRGSPNSSLIQNIDTFYETVKMAAELGPSGGVQQQGEGMGPGSSARKRGAR
mgnify:CR=1 FL=1